MTAKSPEMRKRRDIEDNHVCAQSHAALNELLDHLAEELATEYVRLVRQTHQARKLADQRPANDDWEKDRL